MAYSNYIQDGCVMELIFERFLAQHKATFKSVKPELSSKLLVNLALKHCPNKVESYLRKSSRDLSNLIAKEPEFLLDSLFNSDYLLEVEVDELKLIVCLDITQDPGKLEHKEASMHYTKKVFPELGIDLGLVIYISEETNFTDSKNSYKIAGDILMAVEDLWFAEKSVGTVVI